MSRQYTGVSQRLNANALGTAKQALPVLTATHAVLRLFPTAASDESYTRVAFGVDNTVTVPTNEQPAFTIPNNEETIIVVPTGALWIAAQGNACLLMDVMIDLPGPVAA